MHWTHRYDAVAEDPSSYDKHAPEKVDEEHLAEFGRTRMSHFHIPAIPIPGLSTLEKKLVFFICDHTGAPNPFHALERLTGDCVELERVEKIWEAGYQDLSAKIDALRTASAAHSSSTLAGLVPSGTVVTRSVRYSMGFSFRSPGFSRFCHRLLPPALQGHIGRPYIAWWQNNYNKNMKQKFSISAVMMV